jgi:hypothetical protein
MGLIAKGVTTHVAAHVTDLGLTRGSRYSQPLDVNCS